MEKKRIRIILPTFNEIDNIKILLPRLIKVIQKNKLDADILIIDDNSSDGTGIFAEKLARNQPQIKVMHRKSKQGIGSAYIKGFKESIEEDIDIVFQMDADLSHKPEYITDFIKKIEEGYDLVLGLRTKIIGWDIYRKLVSKIGNFVGRSIAGIKIKDLTTGFRAYKKGVLECIDIEKIESEGYEFQLETIYKTIKKGFKIGGVPIIFYERKRGKSKLSKKDIIRFLLLAIKIRIKLIDT